MSEAYAYEATVPAFPLGQPKDGRKRYGMTPEQAAVYRWLVMNRPVQGSFCINFRQLAQCMGLEHHSPVHNQVTALVERGWIAPVDGLYSEYRFVHPVMRFREPRNG